MALLIAGSLIPSVTSAFGQSTAVRQDMDAQVQSCAACHGENGIPADPKTTPIIWSQTEYWILKALRA
jgi:cytochrome c553